jgi:hypothetical protein
VRWANTQLSGATISSTVFEIYAALVASAEAGVRKDRLNLPRFYSRFQVHFLFLARLSLLLFKVLDFTQLFISTEMPSFKSILADSFISSLKL